jgi:hypothetical protein
MTRIIGLNRSSVDRSVFLCARARIELESSTLLPSCRDQKENAEPNGRNNSGHSGVLAHRGTPSEGLATAENLTSKKIGLGDRDFGLW